MGGLFDSAHGMAVLAGLHVYLATMDRPRRSATSIATTTNYLIWERKGGYFIMVILQM